MDAEGTKIGNGRISGLAKAALDVFSKSLGHCAVRNLAIYPPDTTQADRKMVAGAKSIPQGKRIKQMCKECGSTWDSDEPNPLGVVASAKYEFSPPNQQEGEVESIHQCGLYFVPEESRW